MFSESRERTVKGGGTVQSAAETAVAKQYEALLRVSQNLNSIRCSEELFKVLARELRAVVNFYVMGVGIYDETAHQVHLTSYGEPGDPLEVPKLAPVQFNNAVKPLLVFAAAPYGAIGASIALTIMGAPFGFMAFLGVASLIGVIVSHVILLFCTNACMALDSARPKSSILVRPYSSMAGR